jgi:hypothetical protein
MGSASWVGVSGLVRSVEDRVCHKRTGPTNQPRRWWPILVELAAPNGFRLYFRGFGDEAMVELTEFSGTA